MAVENGATPNPHMSYIVTTIIDQQFVSQAAERSPDLRVLVTQNMQCNHPGSH